MKRPIALDVLCLFLATALLSACDNFHTVQEGQLYRSAQMNGNGFKKYIDKHDIKTVINLRGESRGADWWEEEHAAVLSRGAQHLNIRMGAQSIPRRANLMALLDAFRDAPRPIRVHCQGGADRSGEAAAIWGIDQMGDSPGDAEKKHLSLQYRHIGWGDYFAKDYFIENVYRGEAWARSSYFPCEANYDYFGKSLCGRSAALDEEPENRDSFLEYNDVDVPEWMMN